MLLWGDFECILHNVIQSGEVYMQMLQTIQYHKSCNTQRRIFYKDILVILLYLFVVRSFFLEIAQIKISLTDNTGLRKLNFEEPMKPNKTSQQIMTRYGEDVVDVAKESAMAVFLHV